MAQQKLPIKDILAAIDMGAKNVWDEINDEELLINWLNKLEKIGCNEVLINTHYLYQRVEEVLKKWDKSNLKVTTV